MLVLPSADGVCVLGRQESAGGGAGLHPDLAMDGVEAGAGDTGLGAQCSDHHHQHHHHQQQQCGQGRGGHQHQRQLQHHPGVSEESGQRTGEQAKQGPAFILQQARLHYR